MSKITQRAAVFQAVMSTFSEAGIEFKKGMIAKDHLSKDMKASIVDALCSGFGEGTIELSTEYSTPAELRTYAGSLLSNWLRKDIELNGGVEYVPKNPGSRAGSGDPQMKALKALLSQTTDEDERAEVQKFINARIAELNISKVKVKEVDYSVLPEELRERFAKN